LLAEPRAEGVSDFQSFLTGVVEPT
jgi:hypothetical protein